VGFRQEAFTEDQLKRLKPFVGDLSDTSFFLATYYMYFPFPTCEVKCGTAALDVADRQNDLMFKLKSLRNPNRENPGFRRVWKATISLTIQAMMRPLCMMMLIAYQAVLLPRETLRRILHYLRGWVGEHPKS
jgi:hypothetical protein